MKTTQLIQVLVVGCARIRRHTDMSCWLRSASTEQIDVPRSSVESLEQSTCSCHICVVAIGLQQQTGNILIPPLIYDILGHLTDLTIIVFLPLVQWSLL